MPIEGAAGFSEPIKAIHRHLQTLVDVGLGYVRLGQPAPTVSGGEAQRVKLASELQKRSTGRTVYVLDDPTTGLHFEDIRKLLKGLESLVDKGNTVIVIEHNLDVIKTADWLIDMGPAGGRPGAALAALGAAGVAVTLAACGSDSGSGGSTPTQGAATPTTGAPATTGSTGGGGGGIKTADIPLNGGKIFKDTDTVITQPAAGTFKAFSATCTHQGCPVGSVSANVIHCPCHNSAYNATDGSVKNGPANKPLTPKTVTVSGDTIAVS